MKRFILALVVLAALGAVVFGTSMLLRRNSGQKLLLRAEVAMQARQFDRALSMADRYVVEHPNDWEGYFMRGEALIRLGRYEDARASLLHAQELAPNEVAVPLAISQTYSLPATQALESPNAAEQKSMVEQAIEQLKQGNEALRAAKVDGPQQALRVNSTVGVNCFYIARAYQSLAWRLKKEADFAEAGAEERLRDELLQQRLEAGKRSSEYFEQSLSELLPVLVDGRDLLTGRLDEKARYEVGSKFAVAARVATLLALDYEDAASLAVVREAVTGLEAAAPQAAVLLTLHDAEFSEVESAIERREKRLAARRCLEEVLDAVGPDHPELADVQLALADLSMSLGEYDEADKWCSALLAREPRHPHGRLAQAKLMIRQDKYQEAERALFVLKSDYSRWSDAQFFYGQAAQATGKNQLAREAMRVVLELSPNHAHARRFMVSSLLRDGLYDNALEEAMNYHRQMDSDPEAVRLLVQAAIQRNQHDLARNVLQESVSKYGTEPAMVSAVIEGYVLLGDTEEAKALSHLASQPSSTASHDDLSMARTMMLMGQTSRAEALLVKMMAENDQRADVRLEMARLYSMTGRDAQAIEQYRSAARLDSNPIYRLSLAQALLDRRELDQCVAALDEMPAASAAANLMRLQIRLLQGQEIPTEQISQQIGSNVSARLAMASACLSSGRAEQCIELSKGALTGGPGDAGVRALLAQAYAMLGRGDQSLEQWSELLRTDPEALHTYINLATALSQRYPLEEVAVRLAKTPGALGQNVDMAMGSLYTELGRYDLAAEVYAKAADRPGASEEYRLGARLLLAFSFAHQDKVDEALGVLEDMPGEDAWSGRVLMTRANMLLNARRFVEAHEELSELRKLAIQNKQEEVLPRIVTMYLQMENLDEALDCCEEYAKLRPGEAMPYLLRADVLSVGQRLGEAEAQCKQAIAIQPGNMDAYLLLASLQDARLQPAAVLETLNQLEETGAAGKALANLKRAEIYSRWGVHEEAVKVLRGMQAAGEAKDYRIQLELGNALMKSGRAAEARQTLEAIPVHAGTYIAAQQRLVELSESIDEQLRRLSQLQQLYPHVGDLLVQRMDILMRADRAEEALSAFRLFEQSYARNRPLPLEAALPAFHAMMRVDRAAAAELAIRQMQSTGAPRWRQLAILLTMEENPEEAMGWLPRVEQASFHDALLGLCMATKSEDAEAAEVWSARVEEWLARQTMSGNAVEKIMPELHYRLVAMCVGREAEKDSLEAVCAVEPGAIGAFAMVSDCSGEREHGPSLLKAAASLELGVPTVCRETTMEILASDGGCQWAAALALQTAMDEAEISMVLEAMTNIESPLRRFVVAWSMFGQRRFAESAEQFGALGDERNSVVCMLNQAAALESAGRHEEAAGLYKKVWQASQSPVAANNAAYLMARMWPTNNAKLAEAYLLAEAAVAAAPNVAAFRDTKGWIAYLEGKVEEACIELRSAVRSMPESAEVQLHVGMAEAAVGNKNLSKMHLAAAARLSEEMRGRGEQVPEDTAEAIQSAVAAMQSGQPLLRQ